MFKTLNYQYQVESVSLNIHLIILTPFIQKTAKKNTGLVNFLLLRLVVLPNRDKKKSNRNSKSQKNKSKNLMFVVMYYEMMDSLKNRLKYKIYMHIFLSTQIKKILKNRATFRN